MQTAPVQNDVPSAPLYKSLYFQVLVAIAIGVLLGYFLPDTAAQMKPLGDGFIKLIKMMIAPIIFCTVVTGIAGMENMKAVGKTGVLALLYFEVVSTLALIVGLVIVNVAALDILRGSHSTLTHEVRRYTPERLRRRLVDAGFTVERLTFTNFTPFPVALVLRGFERISGRASEASDHDLRVPAWPVNAFFNLALSAEAAVLRVVNLPIGTSVMAVARKKVVG